MNQDNDYHLDDVINNTGRRVRYKGPLRSKSDV